MASISSAVSIVNRALTKLGANRITSLEDDTNEANVMNSMYTTIRDAELNSHMWLFSIKSISLSTLAEPITDASLYQNQYNLPDDFIRLIGINNTYFTVNLSPIVGRDDALYALEGNRILTNLGSPLYVKYVARIGDTTMFSPAFVEALACRLAAEACETLTNSINKKKMLWQEYDQWVQVAITSNLIQMPARSFQDGSFIYSRYF